MAPSQLSAEIAQESKPNVTARVSANKGNKCTLANAEDKGLSCMSNLEASTSFQVPLIDGKTKAPKGTEDVTVDALEIPTNTESVMAWKEDPDATEYSSSFVGTLSGNEHYSGLSDAEVESQFFDDNGFAPGFDGFSSLLPLRKKKLTAHWRSFVHPLMWRCRWMELRIKELESHSSNYANEIARYDQGKCTTPDKFTLGEFGSRSVPFESHGYRKKAMKRRKRRRIEDTTDIRSYMSQHNLFSYHEINKSDMDGTSMAKEFNDPEQNTADHDEFGTCDNWPCLEENNSLMEHILLKIETVQNRVHKLKAQLDLVMSKTAWNFSSSEDLSHLVAYDAQNSFVRSPTFSACNGDTISGGGLYTPAGHVIGYDIGDLVMPESAVSSYGEAIHIPDIIESTVGLLPSVDFTQYQQQIRDSSEDIVDDILMHNQSAELERDTFINNNDQSQESIQESQKSGEEENLIKMSLPTSDSGTVAKNAMPQEQSVLNSCLDLKFYVPRNKRKRGERKAGSGNWSRQCPGEPDSQ